jgi:sugar (pentulose or hexulose) kinase
MPNDIFIGIDLGTSGARAIAMEDDGGVVGETRSALTDHGSNHRAPSVWWAAVSTALSDLTLHIDTDRVRAICVDGTSGSMLAVDQNGRPLGDALMYNDACDDSNILETISKLAPMTSAAHGATSGAAKTLYFQKVYPECDRVLHQADWVAGQLSGVIGSDDNNALKTGYDPVNKCWPDWMEQAGIKRHLLPPVREPGTVLGSILPEIAAQFGLPPTTKVVAGTTDGCAAFLATGAHKPGDGVTSIGTTLILKIISEEPIFDPASGIYSHRLLGNWLAGGASNTGGGVLLDHFTASEIEQLSRKIDPETELGLDYYPLRKPGERFPIADPELQPRLDPRPDNPVDFLKAIFEGIGAVEALGYAKLKALGAAKCSNVRTVGGAAGNDALTRIRARVLKTPMTPPTHTEAAYGSAILAKHGMFH